LNVNLHVFDLVRVQAPLAEELLGILSSNSPRFSLFAAHDTTLNPLLAALGVWDGQWVPYASMLHVERWTSLDGPPRARLLFNGKALVLPSASGSIFDLSLLLDALKAFAVPLNEWTTDSCAVPSVETASSSPLRDSHGGAFVLQPWLQFIYTFAAGITAGVVLQGRSVWTRRAKYTPIVEMPVVSIELTAINAEV
jgi:hypothetical protein